MPTSKSTSSSLNQNLPTTLLAQAKRAIRGPLLVSQLHHRSFRNRCHRWHVDGGKHDNPNTSLYHCHAIPHTFRARSLTHIRTDSDKREHRIDNRKTLLHMYKTTWKTWRPASVYNEIERWTLSVVDPHSHSRSDWSRGCTKVACVWFFFGLFP